MRHAMKSSLFVLSLLLAAVATSVSAQTPSMLDPTVTQVVTGEGHTCALTTAGAVQCWGSNQQGQLGDESTTPSSVPVAVSDLGNDVAAIAAEGDHTCALTMAGAVKCWGRNESGQLGNGSTTNSSVPVAVSDLDSDVAAITLGEYHTCALTTAGAMTCWGQNDSGQLGNDSTTNSSVPVAVSGFDNGVLAMTAGGYHTCAVTTDGSAKCWGNNSFGQLGTGSTTDSAVPVAIPGLGGVQAMTAGRYHSCALTTAGAVKCWGNNSEGELGDGSTENSSVPVPVSGLGTGVAAITAGRFHNCALTTIGGVKCWGYNNEGQLGDGSNTNRPVPVAVSGLGSGVVAIAAGGYHSCALATLGGLRCWGYNLSGQLGNGSTISSLVPLVVSGLASGATEITAGGYHSCALTTGRGANCWGRNSTGQLGNGSTTASGVPVTVSGLGSGVLAIATGGTHTCALTTAGGAKCWGSNFKGQLGNGSNTGSPVPVDVSGLDSGVAAITAGQEHTCAVTTTGSGKCWGYNHFGQLGNGSTTDSSVPVDVSGLGSGVLAVAVGGYHTCALTTTGGVKCWGYNHRGQLGNGSTTNSFVPVDVSGLGSGVVAIAAGEEHTCAVTVAGAAACWGDNRAGQLGNGSTTESLVPVAVSGLGSGVVAITADEDHTCALTTTGAARCWGENVFGQLGDGSIVTRLAPVAVSGLDSGVAGITAGGNHTCALTTAGGVTCWGYNSDGQLGNDSTTDSLVPVRILTGQSLNFVLPTALAPGTTLGLNATATGAGSVPILYDSWTPDTCTVSGTTLSVLTNNTLCGVRASRAGGPDGEFGTTAAAPAQLRLIRISESIFANGFDGPAP